jgi:lysophospholipase L1-like esterase
MPLDEITQRALDIGRENAKEVLAFRKKALKLRAQAIDLHSQAIYLRIQPLTREGASIAEAKVTRTVGILVAEGDSWFDYPFHDVLRELEDRHGYDVESVAHRGDRIEEIAYGGNQLEELTRRIEKVLDRGLMLKAVLLSGGGNDVAGDEFGMLLNHAQSAIAGLNSSIINGVINERVRTAYITILSSITSVCQQKTGNPIPILIHGYDYPVPDGRGFLGGWGPLPGPWLEPGFRVKGFADLPRRIQLAHDLIDRLNSMLEALAGLAPFAHVHYVDLRNTLQTGDEYRQWWENELHPTEQGFRAIAEKFATVLSNLGP